MIDLQKHYNVGTGLVAIVIPRRLIAAASVALIALGCSPRAGAPQYARMTSTQVEQLQTRTPAVLVVDMQARIVASLGPDATKRLLNQQRILLEYSAKNDIPVVALEYAGYGQTIPPLDSLIEKIPRHVRLEKTSADGFTNPQLDAQLDAWGIDAVILTGAYASGCVQHTAEGAKREGLDILTAHRLISDAPYIAEKQTSRWFSREGLYALDAREIVERLR